MMTRRVPVFGKLIGGIEDSSSPALRLMMLALGAFFIVGAFVLPDAGKALAVVWAIFP